MRARSLIFLGCANLLVIIDAVEVENWLVPRVRVSPQRLVRCKLLVILHIVEERRYLIDIVLFIEGRNGVDQCSN